MSKTSRAIVGFVMAPLVPSCLFWAFMALDTARALRPMSFIWESLAFVFWVSILITLPITLAVGVPVYAVIERNSGLRRGHVLVTSGAVGAAVGLLVTAPHIGALLGLSAGLTFWLIWHRDRDERPF